MEAGNIVAEISVGFAVPPLPQGCPWSGWMLPNLKWCEENLCAWVTAPANTWSNLAYIALGLLMWHEARRMGSAPLRIFGPASIVVGVFSLVYHASYTFFFQFFDFVGMFVFCFVLIVLNWRRLGRLRESQIVPAFLVGVGVCSASVPLLYWLGIPIQLTVAALITLILVDEWRLSRRGRAHGRYPVYLYGLAMLAAGAVCSALDLSRVWCDPSNHWLQGHAAWHVLTAGSLYLMFRFYRGILLESSEPSLAGPIS